MNRPRLALLAVVAATAALACASVAGASGSATTLKLTTAQTSSKDTQNGFVFKEKVFRTGKQKQIGRDRAVCTYRPPNGEPTGARCRVTFFLPKGTLIVRIALDLDKPGGRLTVAGGTGAYEGATGTGSFRMLTESKTSVTIKLT